MARVAVQSVDRVIDLLESMANAGGEASLSELADATQVPLPTIHRLMRTLVIRGYALQLPSRRYRLGPRLVRLGATAGRQWGAGAGPYLDHLTRELGESANLAILDQYMVVYVGQASSTHSMRMFTEVGRRVHCHSTGVGKAMLAQLPDSTIAEIVDRVGMPPETHRTIADLDTLLTEIKAVREQGFAVDDGEQEIGVRCFAVAIPNSPVPAAVSVSGPSARVTHEFGERAVPLLHEVATKISAQLVTPPSEVVPLAEGEPS